MQKFSQNKVGCRIIDMSPDPKIKGRMLVSVELNDGTDTWNQAYSLLPDAMVDLDTFLNAIIEFGIHKPQDPYIAMREAIDSKKVFTLDLTSKIE